MRSLSSKGYISWFNLVVFSLLFPLFALATPTQRITGNLAVSNAVQMGVEPTPAIEGMVAYDSANHELAVYNGSAWQKVFDAANLTGTLPPGLLHCSDLSDGTSSCSTANATANTPSTLVVRDGSGNFSAGTISAALTGIASGNLKATPSNHGMLISSGTNTVTVLAPDASTTKIWTSGGASADPSWQPAPVSVPTTTLGDTLYQDATPAPARLPGNITTTKKFLTQTGTGSISAAPGWNTIAALDVPTLNQNTTGTAAGNLSATPSNHGMLISSGTNTVTVLAPDASTTKVWTSGGASADPSWQVPAGGLLGPGSSTSTAFARWNGTGGTTLQDSVFLGASTGILTTTGDTSGITMQSTTDTTASGSLGVDHNSTSLLLKTLESSTNAGYNLGLSTASIAGANANTTGGISLTTGDKSAGTGNSGGITLTTGATTGGSRGRISLVDGSEGNSPGAVWTISGNGGGGHWVNPSDSKNYIANPDANIQSSSTTPAGWANYFDAAGTAPVDCTGGSPVTALTRNTTTPIGPTTDFRWTKSATSRQGEGFSYDFSIEKTDQAKVMKINFDYSVASGTFVAGSTGVDSDMTVWIYDITNAVLIQPSTYKLLSSATSPPAGFDATFQAASNSTSYRLCVHTGTTSASAYTLAFRNFEAKRARYTYGTLITDTSTNCTVTGSWIANTTYTCTERRVGDHYEYAVKVATSGAPTSAALTINLPTGRVIDTSKLVNTTANTGTPLKNSGGVALDSGLDSYPLNVYYKTTTSVGVSVDLTKAGTNPVNISNGTDVSATVPITFGASDTVTIYFSVPVVGAPSSVQMSDSAPQSDVGGMALGGSQTFANGGSDLQVTTALATVSNDLNGSWDGAGVYTVKVPGNYLVYYHHGFSSTPTGLITTKYKLNSGSTSFIALSTTPTQYTPIVGSVFLNLKASDTLKFYVNNATATNPITTDSARAIIIRLGGNQTIGATETVAARYTNTAGTSIANSGEIAVPFATRDYDTTGIFVTDTATIQSPGKYRINCVINYASFVYAASNLVNAEIYKNGAAISYGPMFMVGGTPTAAMGVGVSATLNLVAADAIQCRTSNNRTAGATTLNTSAGTNVFEIQRIGL